LKSSLNFHVGTSIGHVFILNWNFTYYILWVHPIITSHPEKISVVLLLDAPDAAGRAVCPGKADEEPPPELARLSASKASKLKTSGS